MARHRGARGQRLRRQITALTWMRWSAEADGVYLTGDYEFNETVPAGLHCMMYVDIGSGWQFFVRCDPLDQSGQPYADQPTFVPGSYLAYMEAEDELGQVWARSSNATWTVT